MNSVIITGIQGLPDIKPGLDIPRLIFESASKQGVKLAVGDIVVITSKIISKAEGRIVRLADVEPSPIACGFAKSLQMDPKKVEVVLSEAKRTVRAVRGLIIAETRHGFVCANGGVDQSNVEPGKLVLLPKNPDLSARRIARGIREESGVDVSVIITDTFGRPWREGQTNVAIGIAGLSPLRSYVGLKDGFGYDLKVTSIAVADEIASAAELVMGKLDKVPVAIVRGYQYAPTRGSARRLVRRASRDLFR
jgi:coenzyme F420-0:L-glutamate ligase/coenzyme F420-1:gamma-L-glutamate ligase